MLWCRWGQWAWSRSCSPCGFNCGESCRPTCNTERYWKTTFQEEIEETNDGLVSLDTGGSELLHRLGGKPKFKKGECQGLPMVRPSYGPWAWAQSSNILLLDHWASSTRGFRGSSKGASNNRSNNLTGYPLPPEYPLLYCSSSFLSNPKLPLLIL